MRVNMRLGVAKYRDINAITASCSTNGDHSSPDIHVEPQRRVRRNIFKVIKMLPKANDAPPWKARVVIQADVRVPQCVYRDVQIKPTRFAIMRTVWTVHQRSDHVRHCLPF